MPREAEAVHGHAAFLAYAAGFAEIAEEFIEALSKAALIIHNAAFDMQFCTLNWRFSMGATTCASAGDHRRTLTMARKKFSRRAGLRLDGAAGRRFGVDNVGPRFARRADRQRIAGRGFILNYRAAASPAWWFRPMAALSQQVRLMRRNYRQPCQRRWNCVTVPVRAAERAAHQAFLALGGLVNKEASGRPRRTLNARLTHRFNQRAPPRPHHRGHRLLRSGLLIKRYETQ